MVRNVLSNKRSLVMLVLMVSMFLAAPAMAQDNLGGIAERIRGQLGSFADLLTGGMFLVGIGLGAMAALKFKAHNEDPRNTKITTPIVLLMVSACLIGLPAWLTLSANSVLGEGDRSSLDDSVYGDIQ